jgi:lipopolysaccharide export system protein LptA
MAIQVVNTAGNVLWTADKAEISANSADVTYQIRETEIGNTANVVGNLYATAVSVPNGSTLQTYVGVGNYLVIAGTNVTAVALGTQSSAQAGISAGPSYVAP